MELTFNTLLAQMRIELSDLRKEKRLITGEVRRISSDYFKKLPKDKQSVFEYCQQLLEFRIWELTIIAYDWAYRMRHSYDETTFEVFEYWLKNYISDWWDCDDFCTHAFGELMIRYPQLMIKVFDWCEHENFAVRRAAPVVLILPIKKRALLSVDPLAVADHLKFDPHYLVLKGYGWMLKVLSLTDDMKVIAYLEQNPQMPRVAYRYALEKLDPDVKKHLMKLI